MMNMMRRCFNSSIGMKAVMAVTGLLLFLFVLQHMFGNFIAYTGADNFNAYADGLKSLGGLLWVARLGLLAVFLLHLVSAIRLTQLNRAARPISYAKKKPVDSTFASRTMMMSGLIILFFLLYHLAHFTVHVVGGDIHSQTDALGRADVYYMFVMGFRDPLAALLYVVANLFLGLHLSHGLQSLAQSIGFNHPQYTPHLKKLGFCLAWLVAAGNISMPVAVLLGIITL